MSLYQGGCGYGAGYTPCGSGYAPPAYGGPCAPVAYSGHCSPGPGYAPHFPVQAPAHVHSHAAAMVSAHTDQVVEMRQGRHKVEMWGTPIKKSVPSKPGLYNYLFGPRTNRVVGHKNLKYKTGEYIEVRMPHPCMICTFCFGDAPTSGLPTRERPHQSSCSPRLLPLRWPPGQRRTAVIIVTYSVSLFILSPPAIVDRADVSWKLRGHVVTLRAS